MTCFGMYCVRIVRIWSPPLWLSLNTTVHVYQVGSTERKAGGLQCMF